MTADHTHAMGIAQNQRGEVVMTDYMHQLTTGGGKPGEGYPAVLAFDSTYSNQSTVNVDLSPTLKVGSTIGIPAPPAALVNAGVRRLTPLECERLMGWPDDHTRWRADGTEQSDSARYKQCGNGVVANVAEWIGRHILNAMETTK